MTDWTLLTFNRCSGSRFYMLLTLEIWLFLTLSLVPGIILILLWLQEPAPPQDIQVSQASVAGGCSVLRVFHQNIRDHWRGSCWAAQWSYLSLQSSRTQHRAECQPDSSPTITSNYLDTVSESHHQHHQVNQDCHQDQSLRRDQSIQSNWYPRTYLRAQCVQVEISDLPQDW